jgi:hypothetical protein
LDYVRDLPCYRDIEKDFWTLKEYFYLSNPLIIPSYVSCVKIVTVMASV